VDQKGIDHLLPRHFCWFLQCSSWWCFSRYVRIATVSQTIHIQASS